MNSREKLDARLQDVQNTEPENEQKAMLAQMVQVALPFVGPMIPEDPDELDGQILTLMKWLAGMRSDDSELEAAVFVRRRSTEEVLEGRELLDQGEPTGAEQVQP